MDRYTHKYYHFYIDINYTSITSKIHRRVYLQNYESIYKKKTFSSLLPHNQFELVFPEFLVTYFRFKFSSLCKYDNNLENYSKIKLTKNALFH